MLDSHVSPKRLLLLIPTTSYRTEDFVEAARTLDVDLVIASDRPNVMSDAFPDHLLALPGGRPQIGRRLPETMVQSAVQLQSGHN